MASVEGWTLWITKIIGVVWRKFALKTGMSTCRHLRSSGPSCLRASRPRACRRPPWYLQESVDYSLSLRELYLQREKIERAIEQLERLAADMPGGSAPKRRGRKFMGAEERKIVSVRMKNYWAARRQQNVSS